MNSTSPGEDIDKLLEEVLTNLVDNSLQFIEDKPDNGVSLRQAKVLIRTLIDSEVTKAKIEQVNKLGMSHLISPDDARDRIKELELTSPSEKEK